jgi:hypothetical protein
VPGEEVGVPSRPGEEVGVVIGKNASAGLTNSF